MSIRKRTWTSGGKKSHCWVLDYVDQNGKRRQKSFKTKEEAVKESIRIASDVLSGTHVADRESITIEKASKLWISSWESENLEETTKRAYLSILKYNVIPLIGNRRLNRFTVHDVIQFQDDLRQLPYPADHVLPRMRGRKRSRDAVRRSAMVLGAIFATAQLRGKATNNPVYAIPRKKRSFRKSDREKLEQRPELGVDIPTPDEIGLILDCVYGWYSLVIVVAIFCGLRASELRGLRWIDIDFKQGVIHVRQRADDRNELGPPKSRSGYRTLVVPPGVLESLREWRAQCPKGRHNLVFPSRKGTVAYYSSIIRTSVLPTMKRAGLMVDKGKVNRQGITVLSPKYGGLHAFRHFFASWCINRKEDGGLGLHIKQVQERMGHANVQITMDTYGHLFPIPNEADALGRGEAILRRNKSATCNQS